MEAGGGWWSLVLLEPGGGWLVVEAGAGEGLWRLVVLEACGWWWMLVLVDTGAGGGVEGEVSTVVLWLGSDIRNIMLHNCQCVGLCLLPAVSKLNNKL